jgi:hypothetical protein
MAIWVTHIAIPVLKHDQRAGCADRPVTKPDDSSTYKLRRYMKIQIKFVDLRNSSIEAQK